MSNIFDSLFGFPFVTENTGITQYDKSLSPGIIKQQLSYQYEFQKMFLTEKKCRLVFPFNFRSLPVSSQTLKTNFYVFSP